MERSFRLRTKLYGAIAALLLAHVLAVLVLAASPSLHHWVHPDSDDDDHDCAVVLFLHGGGEEGPAPLAAPAFVPWETSSILAATAPTEFVESVFAAGAVFEHGPPCLG